MRRTLLGVVATAGLAVPLCAQTADELIAKSFAARGGRDQLQAVKTVRMTGTMSRGTMEAPIVVEMKRPASMRSEVTFQGSPAVQATNGTQAWMIPPMSDAQPQALPAEAAREMRAQADMDGPLFDYQRKGHQVELLGKEGIEGKEAYRLKLTRQDGRVEHYLLDAESFLPIRVESWPTIAGEEISGEAILSDYRDVGGVLWPHSIENVVKGRPDRQSMRFSKIEVNVPIDDARFEMPSSAR